MVIDDILEVIVARKYSDGTKIISICGAADLEKSFLAKEICEALTKLNVTADHLTLDSYLFDRELRNKHGLSGYQIESYRLEQALNDLMKLKNRGGVDIYPYDHRLGRLCSVPTRIEASEIVIFDGLHSMHASFVPFVDMSMFVYTNDDDLKTIRSKADQEKRNYTKQYSKRISETEFNVYKTNVEPYMKSADYLLILESKWNYILKRNTDKKHS